MDDKVQSHVYRCVENITFKDRLIFMATSGEGDA
jgi:hypothetical protein